MQNIISELQNVVTVQAVGKVCDLGPGQLLARAVCLCISSLRVGRCAGNRRAKVGTLDLVNCWKAVCLQMQCAGG